MAHMKPEVSNFDAVDLETDHGTILDTENTDILSSIKNYLEENAGSSLDDINDAETVSGWFSRLSAPGYMDCTDWSGPFDTAEEAMEYICNLHEIDADGEEATT